MKKLIFCARDIRDYIEEMVKAADLEKVPNFKPTMPELTDAPVIQKFLLNSLKVYPHCEEYFDAPIYGETGIDGLRLDFNFGLRLDVPAGNFHVTIGDADTGAIFFDENISDVRLISVERYFIRWRVEIFLNDEKVFEHVLNLEGQKVLFAFGTGSLGDLIALLPFAKEFQKRHRCELSLHLPEYLHEFVTHLYPDLLQADKITFKTYATYYPAMIMGNTLNVPVDARNTPMEREGGELLGIKLIPPKPIFKPTAEIFFA